MRQQEVKAVREGQDVASVAAAYGVSERSVYRWLADFAAGNQNALLAKSIPGRPPKICAEEMRWLEHMLRLTPESASFLPNCRSISAAISDSGHRPNSNLNCSGM